MTSYEIGSNSSRYPYDYSFVTDGTNSEYTDTTESNFILPVITGADADKFLQVNAQATGYEYTAVDAELPPQAGQAGKFLETNGSSVFWDTVNQVPGITGGVAGQYLTNNGSTASWEVISQVPGVTGGVSGYLLTNNGSTASWTNAPSVSSLSCSGNLFFTGFTGQMRRTDNVNISLYEEGFTRQISLNVGPNPATRRRLFLTDSGFTVENSTFVVSNSVIHSIAGQLNLNTAGSAAAPSLLFGDSTVPQSGIYGSDNVINFSTDGTERMRIGVNFNDHFQTVTTNARFQAPDGDTAGYRFTNSGDNRVVCNSNVVSLRAQGVNTLSVSNTAATITGNLVVTGTISGSISTPQVAKKTVVIAAGSTASYVYDSGNTGPATTLISNSIQSQKNITLGNMGQSYDGFEFEFMLTGDLNNFGVAVTLSLAGSFVKVRSGAIGVDGSTAGQVYTFSRPMNEFRITGVFVWNGGTPYWVVIDRGVYKQRATNTKFTGGTYTVDRNTPEDVLLTRASATTIDFKNLVTQGGSQEDYDGFNFWLSFTNGTSNNVSFTNSAPVGGSSLLIIGNSGAQTITPGSTAVVVASGQTSTCLRCVFRDTAGGGHGWFVYGR